jgi:general secretion pathway protein M
MLKMNDIQFQRWGAVGLLLMLIMLLVFTLLIPLLSAGMAYQETKNDLAFRLQRYKKIAARKEEVMADYKRIKQQYQQQQYFSTHETVALASAHLQTIIKGAIADAGAQLISTQVLPSKNAKDLDEVIIKVRMTGNMEQLRSIIYLLETSKPLVILDQIDIRPMRGKRNRKTRKIEASNQLNINFQAISFMRARLE